jgi:hypothetical protein
MPASVRKKKETKARGARGGSWARVLRHARSCQKGKGGACLRYAKVSF